MSQNLADSLKTEYSNITGVNFACNIYGNPENREQRTNNPEGQQKLCSKRGVACLVSVLV